MASAYPFSLAGKMALVTGASQGIGLEIARGMQQAGAQVWVHGRTAADLAPVEREFEGRTIAADFMDDAAIDRIASQYTAQQTSLHILVNNAGIEVIMPIGKVEPATLDAIWKVNSRTPLLLTQALLPALQAVRGASVINITSIHQSTPYPHNVAYSMSKAALAMFTQTASIELAPYGIRVNNLAPGAIETAINREVIETFGRDKFAEWIPLGRVGTTAEVVGPAVFLAADASSYVTGATLTADGAYSQHLVRYRP